MFYRTLFGINFNHGFFLDSGNKKFTPTELDQTKLSDFEKQNTLNKYNFLDYLQITPTEQTTKHFLNHKIIFNQNTQGFTLSVYSSEDINIKPPKIDPLIPFDNDLIFTFEVKATDPYFQNYTDLDSSKDKLFLFSNKKPQTEDENFKTILGDITDQFVDNDFLLSLSGSRNLILELAESEDEDKFFNSVQQSLQAIQKETSLSISEKELDTNLLLDKVIEKNRGHQILGYIRIYVSGDIYNIVDSLGANKFTEINTPLLSFINRQTYWKYKVIKEGVTLITKNKYWLSKNGYIEINSSDFETSGLEPPSANPSKYNFPNPGITPLVKKEDNYYSEIFI